MHNQDECATTRTIKMNVLHAPSGSMSIIDEGIVNIGRYFNKLLHKHTQSVSLCNVSAQTDSGCYEILRIILRAKTL